MPYFLTFSVIAVVTSVVPGLWFICSVSDAEYGCTWADNCNNLRCYGLIIWQDNCLFKKKKKNKMQFMFVSSYQHTYTGNSLAAECSRVVPNKLKPFLSGLCSTEVLNR